MQKKKNNNKFAQERFISTAKGLTIERPKKQTNQKDNKKRK